MVKMGMHTQTKKFTLLISRIVTIFLHVMPIAPGNSLPDPPASSHPALGRGKRADRTGKVGHAKELLLQWGHGIRVPMEGRKTLWDVGTVRLLGETDHDL
jgi:hypothetical protein